MHEQVPQSFTTTSKRAALAVATFGAFMSPFDGSVVTLALPSIGSDLGGDVVSLGWVATAYVLGLTICVIPFGRLADIQEKRRVYTLGVALFTLTSAICGLSPSLPTLIATRFFQGVAAAMMAQDSIDLGGLLYLARYGQPEAGFVRENIGGPTRGNPQNLNRGHSPGKRFVF